MKRILIISQAYHPFVGGAEVAVKELTDRITNLEFHMVTNRFDSTLPRVEQVGRVLVHRIGFGLPHPSAEDLKRFPLNLNKPLFQFFAAWKALQLHRTYRYDCVWATMAHAAGVPAGLFKRRRPEVKLLLNLQEGDPIPYIEKKMLPIWPLFADVFRRADLVQALSTYLADWARVRGFQGPIKIVPNGVDYQRFAEPVPAARVESIRSACHLQSQDTVLVTTSRLVLKNGLDTVIRALPLLPSQVKFLVLGTGPEQTNLKTLAQQLNVSGRVVWAGHVPHVDIPAYLQASDIFIRPSRSEGFGASFVEAMAAGLPVIATQEGGLKDFLFDPTRNPECAPTGLAVNSDNPEDITQAVKTYRDNVGLRTQIIDNARRMAHEKYDWGLLSRQMRDKVFAQLLP